MIQTEHNKFVLREWLREWSPSRPTMESHAAVAAESIRCVVHVPPLHDWPSLTQLDPITCPAGASVVWLKGQLAERLGVAARNMELLLRDTQPARAMQDQFSLRHEAARVEHSDPLHVTMKLINAPSKSWSQVAAQAKDLRLKQRAPSPTRAPRELLTAEDAESPQVLEQQVRDPRVNSAAAAQRPRPTERVLISDLISQQFDASLRGHSGKAVKVSLATAATAHRKAKPEPAPVVSGIERRSLCHSDCIGCARCATTPTQWTAQQQLWSAGRSGFNPRSTSPQS